MQAPDWSGTTGDVWARRWRDTDRALAAIGAALDRSIADAAPESVFRALDVGCGPGTTSLALATARPDGRVLGCDLSESLVAVARERASKLTNLDFVHQDAEDAAQTHAPFDLIVSRHGVMFFDDPPRAFGTLHEASRDDGRLIFSCFRGWEENPWACGLASAAAGKPQPPPGREPSGFAFADPNYVRTLLAQSGWTSAHAEAVDFAYVAGEGPEAVDQAMGFLTEIGPASKVLGELEDEAQAGAIHRMRGYVRDHEMAGKVSFPAAAWIWKARAS